jgi:drug/metabolite transporter (DMT)-like permease
MADLRPAHVKKGLMWATVSALFWGLGGVLLSLGLGRAPFAAGATFATGALVGGALNDGLGGIYLFIFNLATGRRSELFHTLKTWPGMLVCIAALFGGPLAMGGYLMGIRLAGPCYAMGISALYPVIGSLLAMVILKETLLPRAWLGITCCTIGAITMGYVPPGGDTYPHFHLGLGLGLLAALGWGIEGVIATWGMEMVDPAVAITIRQATSSFVSLVAVFPLIAGFPMLALALTTFSSLWIMASAALVGATSYLCWYRSFSMFGVGRTMALNMTYPIWGIIFSFFFTPVRISANLLVGAAVITFGSILVVTSPRENLKPKNGNPSHAKTRRRKEIKQLLNNGTSPNR